jgi:hypothetical protein
MADTERSAGAREWVYRPERERDAEAVVCCPGSKSERAVVMEADNSDGWLQVPREIVMATEAVR